MINSINLYSKDFCPAIDCNALMKLVKEVLQLWSSAIKLRLERFGSLGVDVELHSISEVQSSLEEGEAAKDGGLAACWLAAMAGS